MFSKEFTIKPRMRINKANINYDYLIEELLLVVHKPELFFGLSLTRYALLGWFTGFTDHQAELAFTAGFIGPLCFSHFLSVKPNSIIVNMTSQIRSSFN